MTHAPEILLEHHLKRLKLPTVLREYQKVARQCAAEGLDHVQFLTRLVELELTRIIHEAVVFCSWDRFPGSRACGAHPAFASGWHAGR